MKNLLTKVLGLSSLDVNEVAKEEGVKTETIQEPVLARAILLRKELENFLTQEKNANATDWVLAKLAEQEVFLSLCFEQIASVSNSIAKLFYTGEE